MSDFENDEVETEVETVETEVETEVETVETEDAPDSEE